MVEGVALPAGWVRPTFSRMPERRPNRRWCSLQFRFKMRRPKQILNSGDHDPDMPTRPIPATLFTNLPRLLKVFNRLTGMKADRTAGDGADADIQWQLLDIVYGEVLLLWSNVILITATALLCWARTGELAILVWLAAGLLLSAARLYDFYSYPRRRHRHDPGKIRARFTLLATAMAALWGFASFTLLLTSVPFAQFLETSAQCAFFASAVARNNAILKAALAQVVAVLLPLAAVTLLSPDPYLNICSLLVALYFLSGLTTARHLHGYTLRMLRSDRDNARLAQSVQMANTELAVANARLESLAHTDGLTALGNRRAFDLVLGVEWTRMARQRSPLGLLLIDIDHFKSFNDRFGHPGGDDCLRRVAACISAALRRPGDFAARYGGEEFAIVMPDTHLAGALDVGERIRAAVQALALPAASGDFAALTVSVGAASIKAGPPNAPDMLIDMADQHLYCAKRAGRNRVCGETTVAALS